MDAPFRSVLQALKWYRLVAKKGLEPPLRAYRPRPVIDCSRQSRLDEIIGEPALLFKRIETILLRLPEGERQILLGNNHKRLGFASRSAMYRRQYKLRLGLALQFFEAGLIDREPLAGDLVEV